MRRAAKALRDASRRRSAETEATELTEIKLVVQANLDPSSPALIIASAMWVLAPNGFSRPTRSP